MTKTIATCLLVTASLALAAPAAAQNDTMMKNETKNDTMMGGDAMMDKDGDAMTGSKPLPALGALALLAALGGVAWAARRR